MQSMDELQRLTESRLRKGR